MNLEIKTSRLELRPPVMSDAEGIAQLVGEKDVARMLGRVPYPYVLKDAHWWINNAAEQVAAGAEYPFAIYLPGDGLIGSCGVVKRGAQWEIGYWIGKPYWGKGYATEAGRAVLDWARMDIPADSFISGHIVDNPASGSVLVKLGFKPVGEKMMYAKGRDERVTAVRYTLNAPADAALAPDDHGDGHD